MLISSFIQILNPLYSSTPLVTSVLFQTTLVSSEVFRFDLFERLFTENIFSKLTLSEDEKRIFFIATLVSQNYTPNECSLKKTYSRIWITIREGLKLKNTDADRCLVINTQCRVLLDSFTLETSVVDLRMLIGRVARDSKGDILPVMLLASILSTDAVFDFFTRFECSLREERSELLSALLWKPLLNGKELIALGEVHSKRVMM